LGIAYFGELQCKFSENFLESFFVICILEVRMIGEGAVDVFGDLYEHRMICAFMYADGYAINFETFFPDDFIIDGSEPVFYLFLRS